MTRMIWNKNYSVGVDSLDADHITIFSLINHIDEAHLSGSDKHAISQILKVLMDRAQAHFLREEMFMKQNDYPNFSAHAEEHRKIMTDLQSLYTAYQDDTSDIVSRAIVRILCSWLEEHILESDMNYRPYLSE
jgi:hemerythrin